MGSFWATVGWLIVGALLTAWSWITNTIAHIFNSGAFTNILLIILIWEVAGFHKSYVNFERSKWVRNSRDSLED